MINKKQSTENPFFEEIHGFKKEVLHSLLSKNTALYSNEEIISWFTHLKSNTDLIVQSCDIAELDDWKISSSKISHYQNKYFEVVAISSKIGNREINEWTQPIIRQREEGIIGFIIKKINNTLHVLVQAKVEPGNLDIYEMAPTVQCITGSYKHPEYSVNYLECFTRTNYFRVYDTLQSEEGGRFYHEQNRNIVILVGNDFPIKVKQRFIWMTFRQAKEFIKFNNYFNIEARSLLACISPI